MKVLLQFSIMNSIDSIELFRREQQRLNKRILAADSTIIRRFMHLDAQAYEANGNLDAKTKEVLGLCASLVLRCDDCIKYHLFEATQKGATLQEITETFEIRYSRRKCCYSPFAKGF